MSTSNSTSDHANPLDTSTDHSALLKTLSWLAVVSSIFFIAVRTGMKWSTTKKVGLDDIAIWMSMALSIGATIALTLATNIGYGNTDRDADDLGLLQSMEKLVYIFNLVYFFSLGLSMLSITDLIFHLSPVTLHRRIAAGTAIGIVLWTILSVFPFAFQCKPTGAIFLDAQCIDRPAFYTFEIVLNLILEMSLVLQPTVLTWNLSMSISRRITVILCFLGRLFVIAILISQVSVIWHHDPSEDILMDFGFCLTTVLAMNVSIITACTPYLRPFFLSLSTGQGDLAELPFLKSKHSLYGSGHSKSNKRSSGRHWTGHSKSGDSHSTPDDREWAFERIPPSTEVGRLRPDHYSKPSTTVTTQRIADSRHDSMDENRKGIDKTVEFRVDVETLPPKDQT